MNVIIVGCGRVGARTAGMLDQDGHKVTVIDWNDSAFGRLPDGFGGRRFRGNGIEQETLRQAGTDQADVFVAATGGDNRNIMSSQMAKTMFEVPKVITRIKDPERAGIYQELGLEVECRTVAGAAAILKRLGIEGS